VLAPVEGRVTWNGVIAGRAVVVVSHAGGLRSTFQPVTGAPPVGTSVARGQTVGAVTSTPGHCAPRTCLHWGVLRDETYLDPLSFVGRQRVVLLPLP
jgi:murein DD-endopeptidase MepM/ murein hydrolase activator NlpD